MEQNISSSLRKYFLFLGVSGYRFHVTIISRNLTLENFNSGERRSRNFYILTPLSSQKPPVADQRGFPGLAAGPLPRSNGAAAALQRQPRWKAVRPLLQNKNRQKVAHFCLYCRNTLTVRQQKMHAQNSRICGHGIFISEYRKDFEAFVRIIPSF